MPKTIKSFNKSVFSKNDNNRLAFNKKNNNKLVFRKNNSNNKVNRFGISGNSIEHIKKSRKSKIKKLLKAKNYLNL